MNLRFSEYFRNIPFIYNYLLLQAKLVEGSLDKSFCKVAVEYFFWNILVKSENPHFFKWHTIYDEGSKVDNISRKALNIYIYYYLFEKMHIRFSFCLYF